MEMGEVCILHLGQAENSLQKSSPQITISTLHLRQMVYRNVTLFFSNEVGVVNVVSRNWVFMFE